MAVNIGPKIGIDGEAQFRKELNNIIQQAKTLESEMKAVSSSFDDSTDSQAKLEAQTKILNQQIQVQDQRVQMLQKGVEAAAKEFGDSATQTLKWEQALNEAKSTLNGMKSNLSNLENGVEDVTEELEDGEQASFGFGDALKAGLLSSTIIEGVKSLAGNISDLTESTKEYRKIMASLEVSSERAGYSAEETAETYKTLYGVLGDDQTAATTTANLQAIGLEQDKLTELTNAAIGAWATYGDSIPIDGLAESINETIQAGTVTGNFADVLNWASLEGETFGVTLKENTEANEDWNKAVQEAETAEDYFNLALQDANTNTERANLVLKFLAKQGLPEAGKAWQENNDDIVDANDATSDFQDITADLAKKFSPVSTSLQKGFNKIAKAAGDMVSDSDIDGFTEILDDAADFIADEVLPVIKDLFDYIIDNKDVVLRAVEGIGAGFATWKSAEVVSKVSGYMKSLAANAGSATGPMGILNSLWKANPAAVVAAAVGLIVDRLAYLVDFTDKFIKQSQPIQTEIKAQQQILSDLKEEYDNVKKSAWESANAELEQVDYVQDLYNELKILADESGKVSDKDKARADFILNELNEALGTEYSMTGNQIQQYQTMQGEIDKLIEKKRASIMLEAYEEEYKAAIEANKTIESEFAKAYATYTAQNNKVQEEYSDLLAMSEDELRQYMWEGNQDRVALFTADKLLLKDAEENYQNYSNQRKQNLDTIARYEDAYIATQEGNTAKAIELLNSQNVASKLATDQEFENIEQRKKYWSDMYRELKAGQDAYAEELKKGTEGYTQDELEILKVFTDEAKKQMEEAGVEATDEFASTALEKAGVTSAAMRQVAKQAGEETSKGYSDGVWDNIGLVTSAGQGIADAALGAVKKALGIRSPSRVMKELGRYTGEGFEMGLDESMKDALATLQRDLDAGAAVLSNVQPFSVPVGFGNPAFSSSAGRSVTYGDFSIVVNAAPGMDENALADAVAYKLQTQVMQKEAVFR